MAVEAIATREAGVPPAALQQIEAVLLEKKARDVVVCDVASVSSLADQFVIASAGSRVAVQALADAVRQGLEQQGRRPVRSEGYAEARWVCLDYGSVVVHIFLEEVRRYFDLERLWGDVPQRHLAQEPLLPAVSG